MQNKKSQIRIIWNILISYKLLCRSALTNPNHAVIQQINRLINALRKDGKEKEARSIEALLVSSEKALEMTPSRIKQSFSMGNGEEITVKTPIPVDKETSTPLAEIYFSDDLPNDIHYLTTT